MIRTDAEHRKAVAAAKKLLNDLKAPEREARKRERKQARRERSQRIGQTAPEQRQERQRDNAYLAATRREPCVVGLAHGGCDGRIDPAHLRFSDAQRGRINPGKARKSDDKWVNPLCRHHHEEQHNAGDERRWWESYGFEDPGAMCLERYAAFQAGEPTTPVLQRYAAQARPFPSRRNTQS